jgi:hypothetical protein
VLVCPTYQIHYWIKGQSASMSFEFDPKDAKIKNEGGS